ncbi:MAG: hypothetical protein OEY20_08055 [Gemmatimonadota bacterium]|nr:hypothetical protein [Gemmatimonadota bacterium]MDH4350462.1 hypothetical protein [Gemmatimonadota bacterium]MDH5197188.1 hypothetical protein [Gemmatimonadota bacterium]
MQANPSLLRAMNELRIQLTKRRDGDVVLRCIRADGSATWQRHRGRQAGFFPLHDLTHYAVETELGFGRGFYGLIAEGWDIEDTGVSPTRGPLPPEALIVEHIVGSLDVQRADGSTWTAGDFNERVARFAATRGLAPPRAFTEDDVTRLRSRLRELLARWAALPAGEMLELPFDRRQAPAP